MTELRPKQFADFFESLHGGGKRPFPWQDQLARRVCNGNWPEVIALPTAAGKTACIDIAVFALACQATRPTGERTAARRIFFVVDRRVIVDEAYEHAWVVAKRLKEGRDAEDKPSPLLKLVAERLRLVSGDDDGLPLACFQLRGGVYRDDAWARTPTQPTVIASTVDQIGSRLLYRSYGRSPNWWPVHAGLAGNDSLIILDEAHCAVPFAQTTRAVRQFREWTDGTIKNPFHFVLMSATPPADLQDVLTASDADRSNRVLGKRINASKPTQLLVAERAKGCKALEVLADQLAKRAIALPAGSPQAVGVLVNRVAAAKLVSERLVAELGDAADVVLLTGRMRPIDRDDLLKKWLPRDVTADPDEKNRGLLHWFGVSPERPPLPRPAFVVATQCLEVGANLDFDGMVTECASFDALRQRFGRLNRMGRKIPAPGVIVIRGDQVDPKEPDPVYGEALPATWKWLNRHAKAGVIDMGVAAIDELLPTDSKKRQRALDELQILHQNAPVMLPAHLDCWVQTAPEPQPSPDVALFLHGPDRGQPEIQVCWRADLVEASTADETESRWRDAISLCPPVTAECMPVQLHSFRRWWVSEAEDQADEDVSDIEGIGGVSEIERAESSHVRVALRWVGPDESKRILDAGEIRPGDTVVLPAVLKGWDVFGSKPAESAADVGDQAHRIARGRLVLRLHPTLIAAWPDCAARSRLLELVASDDLSDQLPQVREALAELAQHGDCPTWLREFADELQRDRRAKPIRHPCGGCVLRGSRQLLRASEEETFTHEDDTASATARITLVEHSKNVTRRARGFADLCGLPDALVKVIELAGQLHDLGKADERFQAWLHNGNAMAALAARELLAKSGGLPISRREREQARRRAGYPRGGRHELLSVRFAEAAAAVKELDADFRDLLLHLIASHHGHCRPFAPIIEDKSPVLVQCRHDEQKLSTMSNTGLELLDSGVGERFWRLVRRFGWWGIAWLESMLILADHRASEAEQNQAETDKIDKENAA